MLWLSPLRRVACWTFKEIAMRQQACSWRGQARQAGKKLQVGDVLGSHSLERVHWHWDHLIAFLSLYQWWEEVARLYLIRNLLSTPRWLPMLTSQDWASTRIEGSRGTVDAGTDFRRLSPDRSRSKYHCFRRYALHEPITICAVT